MSIIKYALKGNYKRHRNNLKKVAKEVKKPLLFLELDTVFSVLKYGIGLSDYMNYEFYKKSSKERKEYVSIKTQDKFYNIVSNPIYKERYSVKPYFLEDFKDLVKRDFVYPKHDDIDKLINFLKNNKVFMEKPADGLGGTGVHRVKSSDIKDSKEYYDYLKNNNAFVEGLVYQHKDLNKLCDACTNTLRVMTYNNNGKPMIIWIGLRVGDGNHDVDNFHAKGMGVRVNIKTGKLEGSGINKDLESFEVHPKTKIKFDGFLIPYFDEVKDLAIKASKRSDKIRFVGWDIAITDDGPLIIEGNRRPGFDLPQVVDKKGRMDIIREVLSYEKTKN